ncbi:MAG TPA: hypothetical protein VFB36_13555 [Nevskiaceae bacterium]|nr:hypothetical protein [Nevskiaceae bacterium]
MLDEATRKTIEAKFESRELPATAPESVWGGRSPGRPCAACGEVIKVNHFELETVGADRISRYYHPECLTYASEVRGRVQAQRANCA